MANKIMKSGWFAWTAKDYSIVWFPWNIIHKLIFSAIWPKIVYPIYVLSALFLLSTWADALPFDLEEESSSCLLEAKKIEIPGFPHAYNSSIIRWKNRLLLSFRITPNPQSPFDSEIGLIFLDEDLNPLGEAQLLDTRGGLMIPSRAEDGRLIEVNGHLYLVYSNNIEEKVTRGGFRMCIGELFEREGFFSLENKEVLYSFDGASLERREKNWVPFEYDHQLMLAYSLDPHLIFQPILGSGCCLSFSQSQVPLSWNWGVLRGGTPAIYLPGEGYLAFFHSSIPMRSAYSGEREILHYFLGAYLFDAEPPFAIKKISPSPLIGRGFYSGVPYTSYYWKKHQRVIFPGGFIYDDKYIWVTYGRDDHEIWMVKLDRQQLLMSLVEPVIH